MVGSHKILTVVAGGLCLLSSSVFGAGKDSLWAAGGGKHGQPYVAWVSQFPERKAKARDNVFKRTYEFLVSKNKDETLLRPVGILANNPGSFSVLDQGRETIFDVQGKKVEIPKAMRKKEGYFTSLVGACSLPGDSLLFTDSRLNRIFVLTPEDKRPLAFGDSLQQPTGVAFNSVTGEIWVAETGDHKIAVLSREGRLLKKIGGRGEGHAQFNFPTSIWIDKGGEAYIVDAMNFRVQIFDKDGKFESMFGEAGDGSGYFARPKGIATDSYGNIYVSDALFHVVQIFDRKGNFLYTFGKQGKDREEFWMPSGIYVDERNYIYVADTYNSRVQVFQLINGGG